MNQILKNIYPAIMPITTACLGLLIFAIGIGRYRVIIAIIIYFIVKAFFRASRFDTSAFEKVYFPMLAVTIYLDIKFGQIFPVWPCSNPILAFLSVTFGEILISNSVKSKVEQISDYLIFALCPKCGFEMTDFTETCQNCGYIGGKILEIDHINVNKFSHNDQILKFIGVEDKENILKWIKIDKYTGKSVYADGNKLLLSDLIITNSKIVLLKTKTFGRGWKYKDIINKDDIIDADINTKYYINKNMPIISIATKNHKYELYFIYFSSAIDKLKTIKEYIVQR